MSRSSRASTQVNGDELAVTFGEGADDGEVAARIDHIDVVKQSSTLHGQGFYLGRPARGADDP